VRHLENASKLRHEPPVELILSGVSVGGLVLTRRQSRKEKVEPETPRHVRIVSRRPFDWERDA
jgi:hypothetical protein